MRRTYANRRERDARGRCTLGDGKERARRAEERRRGRGGVGRSMSLTKARRQAQAGNVVAWANGAGQVLEGPKLEALCTAPRSWAKVDPDPGNARIVH